MQRPRAREMAGDSSPLPSVATARICADFRRSSCESDRLCANFVRFFTMSVSGLEILDFEGVFARPTTQPETQPETELRWLIF